MKIIVLISTIDDGIRGVPRVLLPQEAEVRYVVSWQMTAHNDEWRMTNDEWAEAEARLQERDDVTLTVMAGRGLCRNRNHALDVAVKEMGDKLEDAVFVIADDDEHIDTEAFARIRAAYTRWPKLDVGLFRVRSSEDDSYFKSYPKALMAWDRHPRSYYPCSLEMTFRSRVYHAGVRFDERFGLGSDQLCAGEEEVFICDARRKGLRVVIIPDDIASTDPVTTGDKVLDAKMLRSKGAVYAYSLGLMGAKLRALREAIGLAVRNRRHPWPILKELLWGIKYVRTWNKG